MSIYTHFCVLLIPQPMFLWKWFLYFDTIKLYTFHYIFLNFVVVCSHVPLLGCVVLDKQFSVFSGMHVFLLKSMATIFKICIRKNPNPAMCLHWKSTNYFITGLDCWSVPPCTPYYILQLSLFSLTAGYKHKLTRKSRAVEFIFMAAKTQNNYKITRN